MLKWIRCGNQMSSLVISIGCDVPSRVNRLEQAVCVIIYVMGCVIVSICNRNLIASDIILIFGDDVIYVRAVLDSIRIIILRYAGQLSGSVIFIVRNAVSRVRGVS